MNVSAMPLLRLSACCAALMVLLLLMGERTLPLFGGDRDLAARVYKTLFMLLSTGVVAGLIPAFFRYFATFARDRAAKTGTFPPFLRFAVAVFMATGPWLSAMVGLGGVALALSIWLTE